MFNRRHAVSFELLVKATAERMFGSLEQILCPVFRDAQNCSDFRPTMLASKAHIKR
jgi:hypothetical protein